MRRIVEETLGPPRLLDRVHQALRVRHYSLRTEEAYVAWIRRFILFHNKRHPSSMGADEINAYLTHLAVEGHVSASTQNQALSAMLFLYNKVLEEDIGRVGEVIRARKPRHLPVVLTRDEVTRILARLEGTWWLMGMMLYGSGLRQIECLRLRVKDVDLKRREIRVRDGKGGKDRVTTLPESIEGATRGAPRTAAGARGGRRNESCGGSLVARGTCEEVPECGTRVGLAVAVSCQEVVGRSAERNSEKASRAREGFAACGSSGDVGERRSEASDLPHVPALLRDAPSRGRVRHPDDPGVTRSRGCGDDDDLHARVESPRQPRRAEPGGPAARARSCRTASGGYARHSGDGICDRTCPCAFGHGGRRTSRTVSE